MHILFLSSTELDSLGSWITKFLATLISKAIHWNGKKIWEIFKNKMNNEDLHYKNQ